MRSRFLLRSWLQSATVWARIATTWLFLVGVALAVRVAPWIPSGIRKFYEGIGFAGSESAFLTLFTISGIIGFAITLVLCLLLLAERPTNWRDLFSLRQVDWIGFIILVGIGVLISVLEDVYFRRSFFAPIQAWLVNVGVWTEPSLVIPPRRYIYLNISVLICISWVEMVEEVYFRGYVQSRLIKKLGLLWGIIVALLLWDLWHVWNPAMFVRRFLINIPSAVLVHLRGRVWSSMLAHPLGNRVGTILAIFQS